MAGERNIRRKRAARLVGGIFNYKWIVKNTAFFLYLAALAIVYIANGHKADTRIRKINETSGRLKDLQYEYKTLKSEMMFKSRESEMVKAAKPLGLTMDTIAPYTINLISRKVKAEN